MRWPRLVLCFVVAALVGWAWLALHPSPEKQIRKQLARAARAATFTAGEGTISKLAGAARLTDFFSTNVEVNLDLPDHQEHRLVGRDEIQQAALASLASGQSLSVTFPDVTVILNADQQTAVADLTLQAIYTAQHETDTIIQEMKFTLRKIENHWLIVKVETVRTLS